MIIIKVIGFLLLVFIVSDNIDKIKPIISILFVPLRVFRFFRQKSIGYQYEGTINTICDQIAPEFFNKKIKIKWLNKSSLEKNTFSVPKDDLIEVYISNRKNRLKTFVDITDRYVSDSLYPKLQASVNTDFTKSNKLYITSKIIENHKDNSLSDYYNTHIFREYLNDNVEDFLQKIQKIDNNNFYFNIFLDSTNQINGMSIISTYDKIMADELLKYFLFLLDISIKDTGEKVELTRLGKYFRYSVVLVASNETLSYGGIYPFIQRIERCRNKLVHRIYITGFGKKMLSILKEYVIRFRQFAD